MPGIWTNPGDGWQLASRNGFRIKPHCAVCYTRTRPSFAINLTPYHTIKFQQLPSGWQANWRVCRLRMTSIGSFTSIQ